MVASRVCTVLAGVVLGLPGCIASNVVAEADREVVNPVDQLIWKPAAAADVEGLFESVEIQGPAAANLWKVYYLFEASGRYAAAALVPGPNGMSFQVLEGSWKFGPAGLSLDGVDTAAVHVADNHIRIRSDSGVVILRRSQIR